MPSSAIHSSGHSRSAPSSASSRRATVVFPAPGNPHTRISRPPPRAWPRMAYRMTPWRRDPLPARDPPGARRPRGRVRGALPRPVDGGAGRGRRRPPRLVHAPGARHRARVPDLHDHRRARRRRLRPAARPGRHGATCAPGRASSMGSSTTASASCSSRWSGHRSTTSTWPTCPSTRRPSTSSPSTWRTPAGRTSRSTTTRRSGARCTRR